MPKIDLQILIFITLQQHLYIPSINIGVGQSEDYRPRRPLRYYHPVRHVRDCVCFHSLFTARELVSRDVLLNKEGMYFAVVKQQISGLLLPRHVTDAWRNTFNLSGNEMFMKHTPKFYFHLSFLIFILPWYRIFCLFFLEVTHVAI